jgi:hypothetical protein
MTFYQWLQTHVRAETALGDLARDAKDDPCLRKQGLTPDALLAHLMVAHDASGAALETVRQAKRLWSAARAQMPQGKGKT